MSIGEKFAVVCTECIYNPDEKNNLLNTLGKTHEIIEINMEQMEKNFCGNILQLKTNSAQSIIVMSETAYKGFTIEQLNKLKTFGEIIRVNIETIEKVGGGSARCMMAEVFK